MKKLLLIMLILSGCCEAENSIFTIDCISMGKFNHYVCKEKIQEIEYCYREYGHHTFSVNCSVFNKVKELTKDL